jgi:hypothetical protein
MTTYHPEQGANIAVTKSLSPFLVDTPKNHVISQLRNDFMNGSQNEHQVASAKRSNKYLRPEHRWEGPNSSSAASDVVTGFVAPQMHHAEVVHLRQDSTSTDNSTTVDETHNESASHMQTPMAPMQSLIAMARPPLNGQDELDTQRQTSSSTTNEDRDFRDPAYANFQVGGLEENIEPKKKGFFASIFKKTSGGHSGQRSKKVAKNRPKSDYFGYNTNDDWESEPRRLAHEHTDMTKSFTVDQSLGEDHQDLPNSSMITHANTSMAAKGPRATSPISSIHDDIFPPAQPLTRKRSMSKPTDLDEILRLQEEEERLALELAKIVADDVFANDPFFQQQQQQQQQPSENPQVPMRIPITRSVPIMMSANDPIYANTNHNHYPPSHHDMTQEIDVDAALGYYDEEAIENIEWPVADPIPPPPPVREEPEPAHIEIDYAPMTNFQAKPKKNFFSFGSKKKKSGKNNDVSYYVEEPQPEPQSPEQQELPFGEKPLNQEENVVPIVEPTTPLAAKPSFFNFKGGRKATPSPKPIQVSEEGMDENATTEETPEESSSLGPIREEKLTSLFNFSKKKQKSDQFHHSVVEQPEELSGKVIDIIEVALAHDTSVPNHSESSRDSSPRRQKKKRGLSGFFKSSSGSRRSSSKTTSGQIGSMRPVDISHLVDEDEFAEQEQKDRDEREPQIKTSKEASPEPIAVKVKAQDVSSVSTEASSAAAPMQKHPDSDLPQSDNDLPRVVQSFGSLPTRGRARKKSGASGLSGLFSSSRPASKPLSQTHVREGPSPQIRDEQPPVMVGKPRSSSLPRGKKSDSGKGFSGLFGIKPSPSQELRSKKHVSQESQKQPFEGEQTEERQPEQHRPEETKVDIPQPTLEEPQPPINKTQRPTKSKSTGGLSGLFSMQPRHARRPTGPPPAPPVNKSRTEEPDENTSRPLHRPSMSNSMSSIASKQRHESKGLSSFLGASPLRKSGRRPVPRSQTFPAPAPAVEPSAQQQVEQERPPLPNSHPPNSQHGGDAYDKIELAPNQLQQATPNSAQGHQQSRVMGRRSGRFRKQPTGGGATPAELTGPHELPPPPPSLSSRPVQQATEQSVMRDIFADAVNRPSRRGSMSSLAAKNDTEEILPADHEYDQAISSGGGYSEPTKSSRKSTSSVGRTESYKQSKNVPAVADDQRHLQNYNSMPRLGRGQRRPPPRRGDIGEPYDTGHQDPESRSLGGRPRSRQGRQGDEQCKMM